MSDREEGSVSAIGRVFSTEQAAAYLGITAEGIRRARRTRGLIGAKDWLHHGAPLIFTKEALDAYRESRLERDTP